MSDPQLKVNSIKEINLDQVTCKSTWDGKTKSQ